MKVFKSIMLYLLLLIGVAIAAVLICCVLMICSPNTIILGYRYVSYKGDKEFTITEDDMSGINALSITSDRMDIYIIPNSETNNVEVFYSQGMSGFVKAKASDLSVEHKTEQLTFDSGDSAYAPDVTYNTMSIDVSEPNGLMFLSDSYIKVYVPTNRDFAVINAYTNRGKVEYSSNAEGRTIRVSNLYLDSQSRDGSKTTIVVNKPNASRYHLKTGAGSCYLLNDGADISGQIIFATSGGKLIAKDGAIKGPLTVRSDGKVGGANIDITNLYGNLNFYARSGNVSIDTISKGTNSTYPIVDMQSEYCSFKVKTLAGTITTQGFEGGDIKEIDVDIKTLTYVPALGRPIDINSELGNINIGTLRGVANLTSNTGKITIKKAYNNLTIETYNGEIDINFDNTNESQLSRVDINALRHCAIDLSGLKGTVNISMARDGDRKINLGLHTSVLDSTATCNMSINSNGNNVTVENISSAPFTVYTDGSVKGDSIRKTEVGSSDFDYDSNYNMKNQYRYNYTKAQVSTRRSSLFVHNNREGNTYIYSDGNY